jgi:DNA-binding transcriptional ArsR family regulator
MRDFMAVTKALSDENRARIIMFLGGGELCVCQIVEMLGLAPSTVSKHLDVLYQAGLVDARKDGRWVYYRLPGRTATPVVREAIHWLARSLEKNQQMQKDTARLKVVLKMSKEKLCCRYKSLSE